MRKLLILLLFCGCDPVTTPEAFIEVSNSPIKTTESIEITKQDTSIKLYRLGITKFNYNGHSYIRFDERGSSEFSSSFIHDPDCDCQK